MAEFRLIALRDKNKKIIDHAKVDIEDFENVNKYKWRKLDGYAKGKVDDKDILLHQFIMGTPPKDHLIDHIDNDRLNNTRANLRFATKGQNSQNRAKKDNCTSKYKGVIWHSIAKKWIVWSSTIYLGSFDDEDEAGRKYDTYSLLKYGEHAKTNNLVNYEDIKHIDINTLLCNRDRDLPKNISRKRNSFSVAITYKKKLYNSVQPTLELAIAKLEEFKKQIETLKEEELNNNNGREIMRNEQGIAIIPIINNKGKVVDHATVSDEYWHECMLYRWYKAHNYCMSSINGKITNIQRFIMKPPEDKIIDHIDNNRLNNVKENLRIVDHTVNNHNRVKKANATSQYFGVSRFGDKWRSEIRKNNIKYNIGKFDTELEAAKAYNQKAKELYGDQAKINIFPENN